MFSVPKIHSVYSISSSLSEVEVAQFENLGELVKNTIFVA